MGALHKLCVYCGSNLGASPEYARAAEALARAMVARGHGLVYGGAKVGIMGLMADTVLAHGGQAFGVIPDALVEREVAHEGLSELHVVRSMHERKTLMEQLSDGFIALPGGLGTLEELFEIWTWAHLGFHSKPIGVLNVAGYYDQLLGFLDHATGQGYILERPKSMLLVESEAPALLAAMEAYRAPGVAPLLDAEDL